ncbi:MAG: hypothetical protein ACP5KY_08000 [Thermoproteus sp.]
MTRARAGRGRRVDYGQIYFRFALGLVVVGLLWSRQSVVALFSSIHPLYVLVLWYAVYGAFIYFVLRGVPLAGKRFGVSETAVVVLLTFAFLIVFNQVESPYAAIAAGRDPSAVPSLLYATEDGVVFMAWQSVVQSWRFPLLCAPWGCLWSHWYDLARDLTYVATPLLLVLVAGLAFGAGRAGRHIRSVLD